MLSLIESEEDSIKRLTPIRPISPTNNPFISVGKLHATKSETEIPNREISDAKESLIENEIIEIDCLSEIPRILKLE